MSLGAAAPEMMKLRVEQTAMIADDIHMFELRDPSGNELPEFTPGSHITMQVPSGQKRRYSLCNDPSERDCYVIAVKKEHQGRGGSVSLIENTKVGDEISVAPPANEFPLQGNPSSYVFIAGGIGITPIRSMIKHITANSGRPFKLYYFTRTPEMMAFRDEFSGPEFRGKAVLHFDHGDPDQSYDLWPVLENPKGTHLYCCGPRGLMEAVRDMTGHWSASSVHFEDFGTSKLPGVEDRAFQVKLAKSGETIEVPVGQSILDALRAHGQEVPSSCESGTCGTCRVHFTAGEADHRDLVLSDRERGREIMVCVSRSFSPELVLDL